MTPKLTHAENMTLELPKRDYTDKEIAYTLGCSERDVQAIRAHAQAKLAPASTGEEFWNK
jgi:FixJ family two-component response regulator